MSQGLELERPPSAASDICILIGIVKYSQLCFVGSASLPLAKEHVMLTPFGPCDRAAQGCPGFQDLEQTVPGQRDLDSEPWLSRGQETRIRAPCLLYPLEVMLTEKSPKLMNLSLHRVK